MTKRLLERQVSLIEYMTSGAAVFGGQEHSLPVPVPEGIDRNLLDIEARFSYAKRMGKITAVLPRTFELLASAQAEIVRAFVETCPPTTINRLENARQFHRFLSSRWTRDPPDPPHLRDVAACEIAFAEVDADIGRRDACRTPRRGIRRNPAVGLLRCAYDVRPFFEAGLKQDAPVKRETSLVIALPPGASRPQVFEVVPAVLDLLTALDDWSDPAMFDAGADFAKLLADLAARGLVEVCR